MSETSRTEDLPPQKYRPDIDGLRAVAALSVVLHHLFPGWIDGGFIGVDIFFVISGFLISTIIMGKVEQNNFSFIEFYSRRVKRIFPSLILVLIGSFLFGWYTLLAGEFHQLAKHIAGGAGFISNYLFLNESGYFDTVSETKPLLHLWSLGIEEQFYILWPVMLWLAWKFRLNLLVIPISIAVISFALNIKQINGNTVEAFYSPQTRFWELSIGAILAHLTLRRLSPFPAFCRKLHGWLKGVFHFRTRVVEAKVSRNIQSIAGATLILTALLLINNERPFPGWWAALPTIGAALIISAGMEAWLNRIVLSSRVLVWFGLISFPLYLWHWPLLSFARITEDEVPSLQIRIIILLSSVAMAWLSYKFIEKPIRFGRYGNAKTVSVFASMVMIGGLAYCAYINGWLSTRMKDQLNFLEYFENEFPQMRYYEKIHFWNLWRFECSYFDLEKYKAGKLKGVAKDTKPKAALDEACFERDSSYEKSILVWGDSHAQALSPGIKNNLPPNWQLLQIATFSCSPDINSELPSETSLCDQSNYFAIRTIERTKPDVVVIAQNEGQSPRLFEAIADKMKILGVGRVILVGPTPHWASQLPQILVRSGSPPPGRLKKGLVKEVFETNDFLKREFKSDTFRIFANIIDVFCTMDGCLTYLGDDVKAGVTTWDYGHLSPLASDYLAKNLLVPMIIRSE